MNNPADLSPHRHISFTAHYTGYIWYRLGWSHPALASLKGRVLGNLLRPLEWLAERTLGGSMRTTLHTRHGLIDQQINTWLSQHPDGQILEIACGLSPRGWRYRTSNTNLHYVEADLPAMAAGKKTALAQAGQAQAVVLPLDVFAMDIPALATQFDTAKPLLIVSEGLVNYFSKDQLQHMWLNLANLLQLFSAGSYVSDIYPEPIHPLSSLIWRASKLLKFMSKSAFAFHYLTPKQVQDALASSGFSSCKVYQPSGTTGQDDSHAGDLVWVFVANNK